MTNTFTILSAEYIGEAATNKDGMLTIGIGENIVQLLLGSPGRPGWWNTGTVSVYVRRFADDLSIAEIHMAKHDGYSQEELDNENEEADRYPLGPKEYWRTKQVGKYLYGQDQHVMTNEEFEQEWAEGFEEEEE